MLRTGVDMIRIERVRRAVERHGDRFYQRFFTDAERRICEGRFESLAARVAAKEAVGKVFQTGIGDVRWIEIEILRGERGEPQLHLHGDAAALAAQLGLNEWSLSLSHTDELALAFVVALGSQETP